MRPSASDPPFPQHFDGKRFYNPDAPQARGLLDVLRWKLTSRPEPSPRFISDVEPSIPPRRVEGSGLLATLVNHSTVLLQQLGSNILTDPVWSEQASPLSSIGPRRRRKPGVSLDDLPPIDAVLLSHNHYDHLDLPVLRRLAARGLSQFIVPTCVARLLRSQNVGPVHELDWGESLSLPGLTIHCVPTLHFSRVAQQREHAIAVGLKVGLAIGLVTAIIGPCTPFIEWTADHLPERRMGTFGIVLIVIGFALQSVQYWVALLDVTIRS